MIKTYKIRLTPSRDSSQESATVPPLLIEEVDRKGDVQPYFRIPSPRISFKTIVEIRIAYERQDDRELWQTEIIEAFLHFGR